MENKIEFSIPGLYQFFDLNFMFINRIKQDPRILRDNVEITSVYGCPPNIWAGGRSIDPSHSYTFDEAFLQKALDFYNSNGIRLRLTFTNNMLEEKHLSDEVCNNILNYIAEHQTMKNDINLASPILEKYIKDKWPNSFNIIYSTTLCIKEKDEIDQYSKNNLLVPDYSVNNDFKKLSSLSHPENIEILVNESCIENCPARKRHYQNISIANLREIEKPTDCLFYVHANYYESVPQRKHYVSFDNIEKEYLPIGINKFKINGRSMFFINALEGYLEYLIKPEFEKTVRYDILRDIIESRLY